MPKTITKKKKFMTVELPKPEAPSAVDSVVGALMSLQASAGWAIVVKILKENIAYLETLILNKYDPLTQTDLTDAEVEILRTKRSLNLELLNTPANYSKVITDSGEVPEEFDPYFKTNDDIKKANMMLKRED
jgi:G3E family GTPase